MARNNTRENQTRELETRETEYVYTEPNLLEIPQNVSNRFADSGLQLRWIRTSLKGKDDYTNVGKRLSEGWEFVTLEEVPELAHTSMIQEEGRYKGTVCRGDLALAKMPIGRANARQKYFENASAEMVHAVNSQLENASDRRMPIRNSSKTNVTKGRAPSFD
jgi:hypothetical protein|tara:strand:- start:3032 stop:3517 length:486 start_codon:yes stop_codon:yes gene_type:complete